MKKARDKEAKREKIWGVATIIVKLGVIITGVVLTVILAPRGIESGELWAAILAVGLALVPDMLRKLGFKASRELELAYLVFLAPALIFGIALDGYEHYPIFDKIVHLFSGILAACAANELLCKAWRPLKSGGRWVQFLTIISFVALTAVAWECFEFMHDELLNGTMQQLLEPGLADTMWDMIWAMGGGIVASAMIISTIDK